MPSLSLTGGVMAKFDLELVQVITHYCDIKTFRFALAGDIAFKPGQFMTLTLSVGGKALSKAFSMSNSPSEKGYVEFTKKISESDYSRALERMVIGEKYPVQLPFGAFTFEGEFPRVAFLCGGIGIAPVRSMIKYATDMHSGTDMVLLYSSRNPECLVFQSDFAVMQRQNPRLRLFYTLTRCAENVEGCRLGSIDEEMIRAEISDFLERIFYVCGPPTMVHAFRSLLLDTLKVPPAQVKTEEFQGYE